MTKNTKHTFASIIMAVIVSAVMLTVSVANVAIGATANTTQITAPAATARLTAKTQLYASIFKKCLGSLETTLTHDKLFSFNSSESLSLYSVGGGDIVAVGPDVANAFGDAFLEGVAFANDNDGATYCRELQGNNKSLLTAFAESLGVDPTNLICSADDHPGLYVPVDYKTSGIEAMTVGLKVFFDKSALLDYIKFNSCNQSQAYVYSPNEDMVTDPTTGQSYPIGGNYIKGLYESWRNSFDDPSGILTWDELDNPAAGSILQKYWLYTTDFEAACTTSPAEDGAQGSYKIVRFENGAYLYQDVYVETKSDYTGKDFYLYDGIYKQSPTYDCKSLAQKLADMSDEYYKQVMASLGKACYDFYTDYEEGLKLWQDIINNPDKYSSDTVKMAKQALEKYNELKDTGDYSNFATVDDSGVMGCEKIGDIEVEVVDGNDQTDSELYGDQCESSGSKLGWILCPIISGLQEILNELYENTVEPMLQINVSVFNTDNGVYQAWQIFQNIANIIFVIVFLFAIFSQITGFGIDNYGIKRLLPKLIVAAILVNLSFIICQALVDVSNIVGSGVKDLLMSIRINDQAVGGPASALNNFISGASIFVGVGGAVAAVVLAPGLLLGFLLGLVSVLISVLFMFVLLGIRQAGVIILVVVSPVAILMYMLPNTKGIFDKWKNIFKALLVLYPICGLMIGGCALASKVIISSYDDFWMALLGALLSVVPFFLVPKMTQGALSAMGKIGGMISGAGQKIGGAARSAAKFGLDRSPLAGLAKNAQDRDQLRQRERERRRLTGIVNRINRKPENARTDRQKRQLAMAQSQLNHMTQEDATAAAGTKAVDYDAALATAQSKRFDEDVAAAKSQNVINGITNKTGEIRNFDIDNYATGADVAAKMEENSLSRTLYEAAQSGDEAAQYAATSQLMAAGHHGAEGLRQVMAALGKDGNTQALQTIAKAAKSDRNIGDLKGGARSSYDFINKIAEGKADGVSEGQRIGDFTAKTQYSKMSEAALFNTDDEELTRMANYISNNRADIEQYGDEAVEKVKEYERRVAAGEDPKTFEKDDIPTSQERNIAEAAQLISQARRAYNNERLRGSAKKSRQDLVYKIAHGVNAPQDTILIDHETKQKPDSNPN